MPDDAAARRAAQFATAVRLAEAVRAFDPPVDLAAAFAVLDAAGLVTPPDAPLADAMGAAYAVAWLDPAFTAITRPVDDRDPSDAPAFDIAIVLGVTRRVDDVTAAALFEDPRGDQPVNQMLGARLADHVSSATVFLAALDRYVDGDRDTTTMLGVLALAQETAWAACDTALTATTAPETRARIEQRRAWLNASFVERPPLVLLDAVAAVIAGARP